MSAPPTAPAQVAADAAPDADPARRPLGDKVGSLACVLIAVAVMAASFSYGLRGRGQVVGPGLFPMVIASCLLLLGVLWAYQAWTGRIAASDEPVELPDRAGARRIVVTSLVLLACALLFDRLDFRLTMFGVPFVVLRYVFGQPLLRSLGTSLAVTTVCYLALAEGLGLALPAFRF